MSLSQKQKNKATMYFPEDLKDNPFINTLTQLLTGCNVRLGPNEANLTADIFKRDIISANIEPENVSKSLQKVFQVPISRSKGFWESKSVPTT